MDGHEVRFPTAMSIVPVMLASYAALRRVVVAVNRHALPPDVLEAAMNRHIAHMERCEGYVRAVSKAAAEPVQA